MKKNQCFAIAVFCTLFCSCTKVKEIKNQQGHLIERYEYKEDENGSLIKNGKYQTWYDNEKIKATGIYENDLKDGNWKFFNEEGKLDFESEYSNDLKNGEFIIYYKSGAVKSKSIFINDTLQGKENSFFENGKLQSEGEYVNGLKNGLVLYYDSLGNKHIEENYNNGQKQGKWKLFNNNQIEREFTFEEKIPLELVGKWTVKNQRKTTYELKSDGNAILTTPYFKYSNFGYDPTEEHKFKIDADLQTIKLNFKNDKPFEIFVIEEISSSELKLYEIFSKKKYELVRI